MPFSYIVTNFWHWLVDTGFNLALLILLALLVPRFGRLAMRIVERKVAEESNDESKAHLAFAGVAIYIAQLIAYFVIFVFMLQQLGFSLAGAAIPATAASAAIGLGAQSIIADFLAGFFVLSERQYGVGDWVRFEGGATTVEGTVIQITMRATHIRTLAEETVIIPNSKAGVSINNSNYWSSAVVVMPIPLLASGSIDEAIQRATNAARRAIRQDAVAPEILGELGVHESVGINPPATVGSPWTVNIRFVVQVNPGTQWRVERSIRTEVIKEFWDEYGSAPTLDGRVATSLQDAQNTTSTMWGHPEPPHPPHPPHPSVDPTPTEEWAPPAPPAKFKDPAATDAGINLIDAADVVRPQDDNDEASRITAQAAARSDAKNADYRELVESTGEELPVTSSEPTNKDLHGWRRLITVGGRTRVSTALLLLTFLLFLFLRGLTLQTAEGYTDGWLAPVTGTSEATTSDEADPPAEVVEPEVTEPVGTQDYTNQDTMPAPAPATGGATTPTPTATPTGTAPTTTAPTTQLAPSPSPEATTT